MRKGVFIPGISVEMFRNASLEAVEEFMVSGLMEDIEIPDQPHGKWIWEKDENALRTYDLLCSKCGYKTFTCENYDNVEQAKKVVDDRIREGKTLFPFCPNCGADMREESDVSDEES